MATDFIGRQIGVGCWLAKGGKGNGAAEYGMILHRVESVVDDKVKTLRLSVTYPDYKNAKASVRKTTLKKGTCVVVVFPGPKAVALFERVVAKDHSKADAALVGKWLHGQTEGMFT